jgi:hypothetical protein
MRGVTDEEPAAVPVPVGDLRREREAAEPLDANRKISDTGRAGDQIRELPFAEVGEPGLARRPPSRDSPAVAAAPLGEDPGGVRAGDHVEGVTAVTGRAR